MKRHEKILTDNVVEEIKVVRAEETFAIIRREYLKEHTSVIILNNREMKDLIEFANEEGIK